jgi:hypothetical protein
MGDNEFDDYTILDGIMTAGFFLIWPLLYLCV